MTTVSLLELVSFIEAGLDLVSGRKPPLAVLTESQLPALARGLVVSSMDMDFDGRVAGLKCWDVLLLSVFSARAAIVVSVAAAGMVHEKGSKLTGALWYRFLQFSRRDSSGTAAKVCKRYSELAKQRYTTSCHGLSSSVLLC